MGTGLQGPERGCGGLGGPGPECLNLCLNFINLGNWVRNTLRIRKKLWKCLLRWGPRAFTRTPDIHGPFTARGEPAGVIVSCPNRVSALSFCHSYAQSASVCSVRLVTFRSEQRMLVPEQSSNLRCSSVVPVSVVRSQCLRRSPRPAPPPWAPVSDKLQFQKAKHAGMFQAWASPPTCRWVLTTVILLVRKSAKLKTGARAGPRGMSPPGKGKPLWQSGLWETTRQLGAHCCKGRGAGPGPLESSRLCVRELPRAPPLGHRGGPPDKVKCVLCTDELPDVGSNIRR